MGGTRGSVTLWDGRAETFEAALGNHALPEILYAVYRQRAVGVLAASRSGVVKQLFCRDGQVIYATSSHRSDSLWAYLLRENLLPLELLRDVARTRATVKRRFGVLLLERGLMQPEQLNRAICGQVEQIAWSLFDWHESEVQFDFQGLAEHDPLEIRLPIQQLVLGGIRRAADRGRWASRLGGPDTVLESSRQLERLIELALGEEEFALLNLVDGKRTLSEIAAAGPRSGAENLKLLYALQVLELVRAKSG